MQDGAAVGAVVLLAGVAVFHAAAAAGAAVGRYSWGGRHQGRLPVPLRLASAASIPVLALFAVIVLARAGLVGGVDEAARWAIWVVAGYAVLGTLFNLASRSALERWIFGSVTLALAVLAVIVATG